MGDMTDILNSQSADLHEGRCLLADAGDQECQLSETDRIRTDGMTQKPTPQRLGYLRVSTPDQCIDRQRAGLGPLCDQLFVETLSASAKRRPVFEGVIGRLSADDSLVVWNLDRAFRSTLDAVTTAEALRERGVRLQIVSMNVDTGTPEGELFYTIMAAAAQFERRLISRRTKEGLEAARIRGSRLGRPPMIDEETAQKAANLIDAGVNLSECARRIGVSRSSLGRAICRFTNQAAP